MTILDPIRTSRIGMGSSRLLSHLTQIFIAEKKNWEAMRRDKPAFVSKKAEDRGCHRRE